MDNLETKLKVINTGSKPKTEKEKSNLSQSVKENGANVIIGDSLLIGIHQHSLTKSTRTKTLVKCFPGATIDNLKHYCAFVLTRILIMRLHTVVQMAYVLAIHKNC